MGWAASPSSVTRPRAPAGRYGARSCTADRQPQPRLLQGDQDACTASGHPSKARAISPGALRARSRTPARGCRPAVKPTKFTSSAPSHIVVHEMRASTGPDRGGRRLPAPAADGSASTRPRQAIWPVKRAGRSPASGGPHARMNAVRADEDIGRKRLHRLTRTRTTAASSSSNDVHEDCRPESAHPAAAGGGEQHGVQVRPMGLQIRCAPTSARRRPPRGVLNSRRSPARAIADIRRDRSESDPAQLGSPVPSRASRRDGVGGQLQSGADLAQDRGPLQHGDGRARIERAHSPAAKPPMPAPTP